MSKASSISDQISARIEGINGDAPYATSIGAKVFRGRRRLDEGSIPCTVIVEGDDEIEGRRPEVVKVAQTYYIEGHAECNPDQPNDRAHEIIADIKRAIFGGVANLGGEAIEVRYMGRTINAREDGLALVSAGIEIVVVFAENPSNP